MDRYLALKETLADVVKDLECAMAACNEANDRLIADALTIASLHVRTAVAKFREADTIN
jgi:hypothetical protein